MTSHKTSRHSLINKTIHIGISTLISRVLGFVREFVQLNYLGIGGASDAFITAFRIPNSLRKIFAEGALTAAFLPAFVKVVNKEGTQAASNLMSMTVIIFEGIVLGLCFVMSIYSRTILHFLVPGWFENPAFFEQLALATSLSHILIYFIFFISCSSLLAAALQAHHHFFVPAIGQIVMNVFFIAQLLVLSYYHAPVQYLAYGILINGVVLVSMHVYAYYKEGFNFPIPQWHKGFGMVMIIIKKFFPCLISAGILEINLFIDQNLASYLPQGSASLLYYANAFGRFPLSVFVGALSTILLPHFATVHTYAPRRLKFYLFESTKLIFWIMIPATCLMSVFSYKIFETMAFSESFTPEHLYQLSLLLRTFAAGLFFFSCNKILLTVYYARHETFIPTIIALICALINTVLSIILMYPFQVIGINAATSIAAAIQMIIFLVILHYKYALTFPVKRFILFVRAASVQIIVWGLVLFILYCVAAYSISFMACSHFFMNKLGYWLWVGPLCLLCACGFYLTRSFFGIKLYFLP